MTKSEDTGNKLQAHFWITATTLAVQAFLMSKAVQTFQMPKVCQKQYVILIVIVGTVIWFLATFLIVEIAASGKGDVPSNFSNKYNDKYKARPYMRKFLESVLNLRLFYKRLWFVFCEFKGAFFYAVLVFCSFVGLRYVSGCAHPVCTGFACLIAIVFISGLLDTVLRCIERRNQKEIKQ
jgi:hypothetical protein